ncbi:RHS repeat-associated core domain-containing protein, partial [Xenorhabdus sp. SGI246]|uniref:RHS repeat-associated core domain-containing protein n=1 Tax=Xenorhabdus sp. SGI246 TaxID=3158263 RepID=UPI00349F21A2
QFAGQWLDEESGLVYNRFRYYSPVASCYLTPDPLGLLGGTNPYAYVHNPTGWVDPLGLKQDEIIRYMSKLEAQRSMAARGGKGGLIPHKDGEKAVWVNHDDNPGRNPGNEKYRAVITVKKDGVDILNKHTDITKFDYKETGFKDGVLSKTNEPKAKGIGFRILDKFNATIKSIQIETRGKDGKWKKCPKP